MPSWILKQGYSDSSLVLHRDMSIVLFCVDMFCHWRLVENHLSNCFCVFAPKFSTYERYSFCMWVVSTLVGRGDTQTLMVKSNLFELFCTRIGILHAKILLSPACALAPEPPSEILPSNIWNLSLNNSTSDPKQLQLITPLCKWVIMADTNLRNNYAVLVF